MARPNVLELMREFKENNEDQRQRKVDDGLASVDVAVQPNKTVKVAVDGIRLAVNVTRP
jgi:hypothetical protein